MGEQNKGFFYLLIGQFLSVLGERISTLVFFYIAVSIIGSDSSFLASALIAVQFIPLFLFGYVFGYFADRYNQKNLMLCADLARAIFIVLLILNPNSLFILYSVVFFIGLFSAMFEPSKKSLIPFIVDKAQLIKLNKVFASVEIFAIFLGLIIGSALLEYFTIIQALTINVISYLISFIMILFIRYEYKNTSKNNSFTFIDDLKSGVIYLKNHIITRQVILNITLVNFFAAGFIYATISDFTIRNSRGLDPGTELGIFFIIIALGASLTPLFNKYLSHEKIRDSTLISYLFLVGGSASVLLGFFMIFYKLPLFLLYVFFFITGIFVGLIYVRILYLLHTTASEKYYGRVISVNDFVSSISTVVGVLLGGLIVEFFTYTVGFILTGLIFVSGFFYFIKTNHLYSW
ncbi:MAG: MFS transporter [Nanoarchaeota archaeon]|nr:MFS transporter [Nanoarchaeota archaeon]